jgi:nucleoside-diphosphate-sugar epimerase
MSPDALPFRSVSITGGTGTVGSQFIKVLLAQFPHVEKIHTTCRNPQAASARRIPASPRVDVIHGPLEDPALLTAIVERGQIVYHLAAWLANTDMPAMTSIYLTNSLVPAVLARLCATKNKRLVFTSSHSVYFAGPYEGRIREDDFPFRRDFVDWIEAVRGEYYALSDLLIAGTTPFSAAGGCIDAIHRKLPPPFEPKIYDRDAYHIYCLTKLLAERFVLDHGGIVLRLSNVYGPGDESTQAVGEACQRIMAADPDVETRILQPFKKLLPTYLGDILKALVRAGTLRLPAGLSPVFTVASQENYLREDALLRAVAKGLNKIRGTQHNYRIEALPAEAAASFTYDLGKMRRHLLYGEELMPLEEGVRAQLAWLIERAGNQRTQDADLAIEFA